MLFYWIIFQNKSSPFNSRRSYCRNVHRSDGKHGERVNRGLVSVDTERESSLMSQRTVTYACFAKKNVTLDNEQLLLQTAGMPLEPANPDCSFVSLLSLFPFLECRFVVIIAYCVVFLPVCCSPKWSKKPVCSCCLLWLLL